MNIRYAIVPYVAPASPAFVVGVEFYRDLTINQHWSWMLAALTAIALAGTIELGGVFAAKGFTDFWSKEAWVRMGIAFLALVGYAYFGITLTWGTTLWPVFIFVTLLYLVIASIDTYKDSKAEEQTEKQREIDAKKIELQIAKQKASAARARAREAQFSGFGPENSPKKPEINTKVENFLSDHPDPKNAKVQEIADGAGVSLSTASEHKKRYLGQEVEVL